MFVYHLYKDGVDLAANKLDSIMESAYTNSPCVCEPCPAGGHSYQMAVALVPKIFMR